MTFPRPPPVNINEYHDYFNNPPNYFNTSDDNVPSLAGWGIEPHGVDLSDQFSLTVHEDDDDDTQFDDYYTDYLGVPATSDENQLIEEPQQNDMQPLKLHSSEPGETSILMSRERLKIIAGGSLNPRLGLLETSRFLDRFRYIYISSPLLDKDTPLSSGGRTNQPKCSTKKSMCFCQSESTGETSGIEQRASSSGSMIIILALLDFAVKNNKCSGVSAQLAINYGTILYLFAYSRRRALLQLRNRVLFNAAHFVKHCKAFEVGLSKCISLIRKTELVPEEDASDLQDGRPLESGQDYKVMGKHLRSSASAALYLITSVCLHGIQELLQYCNHSDLNKYLEIYEVDISVIDEFGWERVDGNTDSEDEFSQFIHAIVNVPREEFLGSSGEHASIQKIKFDMFKLHFLRRFFICCLLSICSLESLSTTHEFRAWSTVEVQLDECSNFMKQLARTLVPTQVAQVINAADLRYHNTVSEDSTPVWQRHARSLNFITSSLQLIEGRMRVLRDSSISLINEFAEDTPGAGYEAPEDDFERNFEIIGRDIKVLQSLWESSKKEVDNALKHTQQRDSMVKNPRSFMLSSVPLLLDQSPYDYDDRQEETMMMLSPTTRQQTAKDKDEDEDYCNNTDNSMELLQKSKPIGTSISVPGTAKKQGFTRRHRRQSSEFTSLSGATMLEVAGLEGATAGGGGPAVGGMLFQNIIALQERQRNHKLPVE